MPNAAPRPESFASGLIYGLLEGPPLQTAVEYGAAHGALAMTTPGDTTMATKAEVLNLARGGGARVDRQADHEKPIHIKCFLVIEGGVRVHRQCPVGYG